MSACSCGWDDYCIGGRISPIQIARKPGYFCATCGSEVFPGQACVDSAWLLEGSRGGFAREHAVCHELNQRFKSKVCGYDTWYGGMGGRDDLEEAAQHAVANGDEDYWREWLELYEQSWEFWGERQEQ